MLLNLPVELRLLIYEFYVELIQRVVEGHQPRNAHWDFLRTCRTIAVEAEPISRTYISLRNERQIRSFISHAEPYISQIRRADVACDGRVITRDSETVRCPPVHHIALTTADIL